MGLSFGLFISVISLFPISSNGNIFQTRLNCENLKLMSSTTQAFDGDFLFHNLSTSASTLQLTPIAPVNSVNVLPLPSTTPDSAPAIYTDGNSETPTSPDTSNVDPNNADCSIFIGSTVNVYYWPTGTPNTDCLAGLPSSAMSPPPEISNLYPVSQL